LRGCRKTGEVLPFYILVPGTSARKAIDFLQLSASERSETEMLIRKLEESLAFASKRQDSISVAQKDIIEDMVLPYISDLKEEPNIREWIKCIGNIFKILAAPRKELVANYLLTAGHKNSFGKSFEFYDSLYTVSKIYANVANLESALEQSGSSLPSERIVQQTVLAFF
jgi:hypothetical protein